MTRIACCQLDPTIADLPANSVLVTDTIDRAVRDGADIVVLPELVTSGYLLAGDDEARSVALTPADDRFTTWAAAAGDSLTVLGFCELGADGRLYNSAAVLDGGEVTAVYRKTHLFDRESLLFTPGDTLPPVLATRFGAVAVMVCYDLEFPEVTRDVAVRGADIVVAPVNWPLVPRPAGERPGEVITAMSTARVNRLAIAACDRAGTERGQEWTAGTSIVDADGWVVAEAGTGVGTAVADLDLTHSRDKKLTDHVDLLADRRLDLY